MTLQHAALRNNANNKQRGAYTKSKPIGKGAFGDVFLVTKNSGPEQKNFMPEPLVLKEVSMKGMNARDQKSTMNEVDILKRLDHPNIIAFHESFVDGDTLCVVMEYAPGGDLSHAIAMQKKTGKRFPETTVLRYIAEIASAMAHCHHDLHLLHRDLKPQNIFIGKGGALKLGDFGISKVMAASRAMAQTQCGTPLYMAPEICRGARYDRGADVWACGCVLYELMALAAPWMDRMSGPNAPDGISGLLKLITNNSLNLTPLRAYYSAELCTLLGSLLAKSAAERPSLATVLAMPLVQRALPPQQQLPPTPPMPAPPMPMSQGASPAGSAAKYRPGTVVMVKRTSGAETMAVVDKHEAASNLYTLSLLSPLGKVEGSKQAPESDLREPSSTLELQLVRQQAVQEQQRARARKPAYGGEWAQGGIEEHAAAVVLQQAFASKRASQRQQQEQPAPTAQPHAPDDSAGQQPPTPGTLKYKWAAASPAGSAAKYRPGTVVMVKRTSGAETMAVVDKHETASNLYTLSLLSPSGKVEGLKQAPEPDLRPPNSPIEQVMMRLQQQRKAAAELLQRSFHRKKAPNVAPPALAPILESPAGGPGPRQGPVIYKHAANAVIPQPGRQQQQHPSSLQQQQDRLAKVVKVHGGGIRVAAAPGARVPFRPLF